ncbi:alpha/beta hydrolase [Paenibacillus oryzisoli]|uniref:alpha/beta fold hydrolase n=1 Tax=Paenibacillus oryzisoli TaxID=1850517 RepID=UPI003D267C59
MIQKQIGLQNGTLLEVQLTGCATGPVIMLPGAKTSVYGAEAEALKQWGVDPELGRHLSEGLSDTFQVLTFDYEKHIMQHPQPETFTPANIVQDLLRIADGMDVKRFSYYGYSWLAVIGLQLALRTDRLDSLVMGGFPPYRGPYDEMLAVTTATHTLALAHLQTSESTKAASLDAGQPDAYDWDAAPVALNSRQTQQFRTLYAALSGFDDTVIHEKLRNLPKLVFAGEADTIVYGERFGGVTVDIAGRLQESEVDLTRHGWDVAMILGAEGDHTKAMQPAAVLPVIVPWLLRCLVDPK